MYLFKQTLGHTLAFTQTDRVRRDTSITLKQTTERPLEQEYRQRERLSEYRTEERNAYFGKSLVRLACIEEKNRNQKTEHKSEQPQTARRT